MSTTNDGAPAPLESSQQGRPGVVRGAFVVLEGLDRSGKTTQVKLLESRLVEAGRRVQVMRFPGEFIWVVVWVVLSGWEWVHRARADVWQR